MHACAPSPSATDRADTRSGHGDHTLPASGETRDRTGAVIALLRHPDHDEVGPSSAQHVLVGDRTLMDELEMGRGVDDRRTAVPHHAGVDEDRDAYRPEIPGRQTLLHRHLAHPTRGSTCSQ